MASWCVGSARFAKWPDCNRIHETSQGLTIDPPAFEFICANAAPPHPRLSQSPGSCSGITTFGQCRAFRRRRSTSWCAMGGHEDRQGRRHRSARLYPGRRGRGQCRPASCDAAQKGRDAAIKTCAWTALPPETAPTRWICNRVEGPSHGARASTAWSGRRTLGSSRTPAALQARSQLLRQMARGARRLLHHRLPDSRGAATAPQARRASAND